MLRNSMFKGNASCRLKQRQDFCEWVEGGWSSAILGWGAADKNLSAAWEIKQSTVEWRLADSRETPEGGFLKGNYTSRITPLCIMETDLTLLLPRMPVLEQCSGEGSTNTSTCTEQLTSLCIYSLILFCLRFAAFLSLIRFHFVTLGAIVENFLLKVRLESTSQQIFWVYWELQGVSVLSLLLQMNTSLR